MDGRNGQSSLLIFSLLSSSLLSSPLSSPFPLVVLLGVLFLLIVDVDLLFIFERVEHVVLSQFLRFIAAII